MMCRSTSIIALFCIVIATAQGNTNSQVLSSGVATVVSAYSTMLSNAPAMLGQYYVAGTSGTLGNLGEALASQEILNNWLHKTGNWISLSPRVGRQGLDHIFIKTDANGMPRGLIVGESKYGHSPLGMTHDGIQMGSNWTNKRLIAMGNRYIKLSTVAQLEKIPGIGDYHELKVVLKNGKEVCFWRKNSRDSWKFSGTKQELPEAQKMANTYGDYLKNAGKGIFTYRSRVFQIQPDGDDIIIRIKDASNVDSLRKITHLPTQAEIRLADGMKQKIDSSIVASNLKKKMSHLSDKEIKTIADDLCSNAQRLTRSVSAMEISGRMALNAGFASLSAIGVDVAIQLIDKGEVDWGRSSITGGAVFTGAMTGQALNLGLNHWNWSQNMFKTLSGKLGCSAGRLGSAFSSFGGGVLASALMSYGMYFFGYSDLDIANLNFVAGSVGTLAGTAAGFATVSIVSALGTASTSTAISSLSGAAASNAALACLGGGALSAGGGGIAVGTMVVGGVAVITAVAASYAVYVTYNAIVEYKERENIRFLLTLLSNASNEEWKLMLRNNHIPVGCL